MGANVNDVYKFVQFVANKSQDGGYISPDEFNRAAKIAQKQWGKDVYNNPKQYQPGRPVPVSGFAASQKVLDNLSILKTVTDLSLDAQGNSDLPSDYSHASSLRYKYKFIDKGTPKFNEVEVEFVADSALGNRLSGSIVQPTDRYPIYTQYNKSVRVWPNDLGKVVFTYLREFIDPVWAFDLVNNLPVYNGTTSVDFEIDTEETENLVMRICSYLGINMREQLLTQYAETLKAQD